MLTKTSISRFSLASALVLLVGAGTPSSTTGPPEPVALRPTASVQVDLNAEIYLRRLADSSASRLALEDSLRVILEEHFGYVAWTSDTGATYSVRVTVDQNVSGTDPSFLQLALSGWPQDSVVPLKFEENGEILDRRDWSVAGVADAWAARLRELARDKGTALQQDLMFDMPLIVPPELVQFEVVIRVPSDTLRAARNPNPEFKVRVAVVDTFPIVSEDTASFHLWPCRSNSQVYSCEIKLVEYMGRSIDGADVPAKLGTNDITLTPLTVHLWLYHPNQDTR